MANMTSRQIEEKMAQLRAELRKARARERAEAEERERRALMAIGEVVAAGAGGGWRHVDIEALDELLARDGVPVLASAPESDELASEKLRAYAKKAAEAGARRQGPQGAETAAATAPEGGERPWEK